MQQSLHWQIKYLRAIMEMQAVWTMTRVFCCVLHKNVKRSESTACSRALMVMKGFAFCLSFLHTVQLIPKPSLRRTPTILRLWFPHARALFFNQISELQLVTYVSRWMDERTVRDLRRSGPDHRRTRRRGGPITRPHLEPHQLERFVPLVLGVLKMSSWRTNCQGVWRCDNEAGASRETLRKNKGEHMLRSTRSIRWIQSG